MDHNYSFKLSHGECKAVALWQHNQNAWSIPTKRIINETSKNVMQSLIQEIQCLEEGLRHLLLWAVIWTEQCVNVGLNDQAFLDTLCHGSKITGIKMREL